MDKLPEVKNKKKIDVDKFVKLANRVKKIFEEEDKYLAKKYGDSTSRRLLTNH